MPTTLDLIDLNLLRATHDAINTLVRLLTSQDDSKSVKEQRLAAQTIIRFAEKRLGAADNNVAQSDARALTNLQASLCKSEPNPPKPTPRRTPARRRTTIAANTSRAKRVIPLTQSQQVPRTKHLRTPAAARNHDPPRAPPIVIAHFNH